MNFLERFEIDLKEIAETLPASEFRGVLDKCGAIIANFRDKQKRLRKERRIRKKLRAYLDVEPGLSEDDRLFLRTFVDSHKVEYVNSEQMGFRTTTESCWSFATNDDEESFAYSEYTEQGMNNEVTIEGYAWFDDSAADAYGSRDAFQRLYDRWRFRPSISLELMVALIERGNPAPGGGFFGAHFPIRLVDEDCESV